MRMARLLRGLALALVGAAFATAAGAVDMTGTWEGRESCHCFNEVDGRFTEKYRDQVMEITQDGTDLNIEAYGELFNGNVIGHPRSNSKGEASLIACDTDPTDNASFGEMGRAKVSAKANGRGRMTLQSLWNAQEGQVCTCKSKMHRTSASDPEVDDCSGGTAVDKWHKAMLGVAASDAGCYEVEYPSPDWVEVVCGEASSKRSRSRSFARTVGNGDDWSVKVSGTDALMQQVTGSFENVSGVKTITDSYAGDNHWTLQLNSNSFKADVKSACASSPNPDCEGWVQYVYYSNGDDTGEMTIWHILIDYNTDNATCPSQSWDQVDHSCYLEAVKSAVPPVTPAQLSDMQLTGIADPGQPVEHAVIRVGQKLYKATVADSLSFNGKWNKAEFNVFGHGGGSMASFNSNSSLDVKITLDSYSGSTLKCNPNSGTTGEMNNLNLVGGCNPVPKSSPAAFTFNENNK